MPKTEYSLWFLRTRREDSQKKWTETRTNIGGNKEIENIPQQKQNCKIWKQTVKSKFNGKKKKKEKKIISNCEVTTSSFTG